MKVKIQKLDERAQLPQYQTDEAAGADLHACLDTSVVIEPGAVELVPAGIALEIPKGYEIQIRPRSGLALKHGVTVLNSPGTVDSDYRGEIKIMLINHGKQPFVVQHGERIAQMVVARHEKVELEETDKLSKSKRSTAGFGSTGK